MDLNLLRERLCTVGGNVNCAATVENSVEIPQKTKNRTTVQSSNSISATYLKKMKTLIRKDICTPMFITPLFTIAKIWNQPKHPSVDEWMKNM